MTRPARPVRRAAARAAATQIADTKGTSYRVAEVHRIASGCTIIEKNANTGQVIGGTKLPFDVLLEVHEPL